jgi:hypothetical protein
MCEAIVAESAVVLVEEKRKCQPRAIESESPRFRKEPDVDDLGRLRKVVLR